MKHCGHNPSMLLQKVSVFCNRNHVVVGKPPCDRPRSWCRVASGMVDVCLTSPDGGGSGTGGPSGGGGGGGGSDADIPEHSAINTAALVPQVTAQGQRNQRGS